MSSPVIVPNIDYTNQSGEGTYKMLGEKGVSDVPFSQVPLAMHLGMQLQPSDIGRYLKDSAGPAIVQHALDKASQIVPVTNLKSAGNDILSGIVGLTSPIVHPVKTAKTALGLVGAAFNAPNPFTEPAEEGLVQPFIKEPDESSKQYIQKLGGVGLSLLPSLAVGKVLAPEFGELGNQLENPSAINLSESIPSAIQRSGLLGKAAQESAVVMKGFEKPIGPPFIPEESPLETVSELPSTLTSLGISLPKQEQVGSNQEQEEKPKQEQESKSPQIIGNPSPLIIPQVIGGPPSLPSPGKLVSPTEIIPASPEFPYTRLPDYFPEPTPGIAPIESKIPQETPQISALKNLFGITPEEQNPIVNEEAGEKLKEVLASHINDLFNQPIHIDPITGISDFYNYLNTVQTAKNQSAIINVNDLYRQQAEQQIENYRKINRAINIVNIREQHPDEYIKDIWGEGDPYAFTKAEPSLGRLPSLVHQPELEGFSPLDKLKKHLMEL